MQTSLYPRLSEAADFLSRARSDLAAVAARLPLRADVAIELLPICEEGLFGYELVPDQLTHTYLIIGHGTSGEPTLRKTVYGTGLSPNGLRLATINGRALARSDRRPSLGIRTRDIIFGDLSAAVEAAWRELVVLFPGGIRQPAALRLHAQRCLDEALSVTNSHLSAWDPFIVFYGIPGEAERGYKLFGDRTDERGELIFQKPDIWMLRWKAPPRAVYESWSVTLPDTDFLIERGAG